MHNLSKLLKGENQFLIPPKLTAVKLILHGCIKVPLFTQTRQKIESFCNTLTKACLRLPRTLSAWRRQPYKKVRSFACQTLHALFSLCQISSFLQREVKAGGLNLIPLMIFYYIIPKIKQHYQRAIRMCQHTHRGEEGQILLNFHQFLMLL